MAAHADERNARSYWTECERQLFSMAGMNPDQYEKIILAVRALADELSDVDSHSLLMSSWEQADEFWARAAKARGFPTNMLPKEQISGAAFALRERELTAQLEYREKQNRIATARQTGEAWVKLEETGNIDAGLFDPYRSLEMHIASGLAVMSMVQMDPESGAPDYVVSVVRLDGATGALIDAEPGIADWLSHSRAEQFLANRKAARQQVEDRVSDSDSSGG